MDEKEEDTLPAAKLLPELWTQILARLPAIDLLRFRCVSKTWCSMIDDPDFIHMHLTAVNENSDNHRFFLFWENYLSGLLESHLRIRGRSSEDEFKTYAEITSMKYSLPLLAFEHLGYINGLMLFTTYVVDSRDHEGRGVSSDPRQRIYLDLYLFNPSIRKLLVLPPLPFHPGRCPVFIFGFDALGNDHKVVGVQFPIQVSQGSSPGFILVYELTTRCWRVNTSSNIQVQDKGNMGKGVYAKGFMHWLYYDSSLTSKPRNYTHFVTFDFSSEEFSYSPLPGDNRINDNELLIFPFVLGDSFAIFDVSCTSTCIWVMKKYEKHGRDYSWSKWYNGDSDLSTFGFFKQHKDGICHVLYIETIRKFLLSVQAKVIVYDIETRMMESLISQCFCVMEPYAESLLLCKGIGSPFFNTTFSRK